MSSLVRFVLSLSLLQKDKPSTNAVPFLQDASLFLLGTLQVLRKSAGFENDALMAHAKGKDILQPDICSQRATATAADDALPNQFADQWSILFMNGHSHAG